MLGKIQIECRLTSSNNEKVDRCIGSLVYVLSKALAKAFRDELTLNLNLPVEFRAAFSPRTARGGISQDGKAGGSEIYVKRVSERHLWVSTPVSRGSAGLG